MTNNQFLQIIRGYQPEGGAWAPTNSHRGRLGSWVAVGCLIAGFAVAGFAFVGTNWWRMAVAALLMLVGAVLCLVTDIFTDVVLDDPRDASEEPHSTPLRRIKQRLR